MIANVTEYSKKIIEESLKIPYEEFEKMDFDEQQEIIKKYKNKKFKNKKDNMHNIIMIGEGEHSVFVEADITPEKVKKRLDNALEKSIKKEKIKKLTKRFKNV